MMATPNKKITISTAVRAATFGLMAMLCACGGSTTSSTSSNGVSSELSEPVTTTPPNTPTFASPCLIPQGSVIPIPDENDPDIPTITLNGDHVVFLSIGETYEEPGATALDPIDGNITDSIDIQGEDTLDTNVPGDYLIRYNVQNSSDIAAREVVRIVRIADEAGNFATQSSRTFGTTSSIHGYFEHLPETYSNDEPAPLIIFNHGIGETANFFALTPGEEALNRALGNSPAGLIDSGDWDFSRPFVVLTPQRCRSNGLLEALRINRFMNYAIQTYNIDTSRIYMVGFSAGAFVTWLHESLFPEQVAAIGAIAGGTLDLADACDVRNTPSWTFHAEDDTTVPVSVSTGLFDLVNECDPPAPVAPRLTVFPSGGHLIVNPVMNLSLLGGGLPEFNSYDQSIYDWLLSHTRP